jgi:hypothetical protein
LRAGGVLSMRDGAQMPVSDRISQVVSLDIRAKRVFNVHEPSPQCHPSAASAIS